MRLLVYGSQGWIGTQFTNYLTLKSINFIKGIRRMDNLESLSNELNSIKPTHIISFIGRTHGRIGEQEYSTIDYLEQEGRLVENIRDNLLAPISLALMCQERNIHYTYLGTGCIFNYDTQHPVGKEINGFTEQDKPNFLGSSYSIEKGFTDMLMHQLEKNTLNLRIRMPITADNSPRNFITKITNYPKICSIANSMTVLSDFYPIILDLLLRKETGTLNLTNPGLISHNEILEMYKEHVDPTFTYSNFSIEEQNQILASGRSNNYLNTSKLERMYPSIKNIKESVLDIMKQYIK